MANHDQGCADHESCSWQHIPTFNLGPTDLGLSIIIVGARLTAIAWHHRLTMDDPPPMWFLRAMVIGHALDAWNAAVAA